MRNLLALLILFIVCCNQKQGTLNMVGAYAMTKQILNDGTKDSVIDRPQLKIYTDHYMMYATPNVPDTLANYGLGQYKVEDGKIVEHIFYTSTNGDKKDTAILVVDKSDKGYKQVIENIPYQGKNYRLTEEYDAVSKSVTSPLDGAWKQIEHIFINSKGDSSITNNPLEYKVFQSGYFIWGITVTDSANKKVSYYGYGTFVMDGKNKTRETVTHSTLISSLVGKTYEVDIEFLGDNSYKQTITFARGEKSIEIYQKLK